MKKLLLSAACMVFLACAPQTDTPNEMVSKPGGLNKMPLTSVQDRTSSPDKTEYHVFQWQWEPKEKSFRVLMPQGWNVEGGMNRIDPTAAGGAANAIEAKLDFVMKKDAVGTVMMHWYPDTYYFDMRHSPAGQMGLFPTGSNYNGMTVLPLPSAVEYIELAFPYARPAATELKIVSKKNLPELAAPSKQKID